jgi:hypothetical protein
MRDFKKNILGGKSDLPLPQDISYGEFETTRNFTYPRSYYMSIEPTIVDIYHRNREIPPRGSGEGMYEWIESAFDSEHIKKSGEIHALDFNDSPKSVREFGTIKAWFELPSIRKDRNTLWETGTHISKK